MLTSSISFILSHKKQLFPFAPWVYYFILLFVLCLCVRLFCYKYQGSHSYLKRVRSIAHFVVDVAKNPLWCFLSLYVVYLLSFTLMAYQWLSLKHNMIKSYVFFVEFIVLFWCILGALRLGNVRLLNWLRVSQYNMVYIIFKMLDSSLQAVVCLILFNMILPELGLTGLSSELLSKIAYLLLIGVIGWIAIQIINGLEQLILSRMSLDPNNFNNRKITTQVRILKKIFLSASIFITISAMLMIFDGVRNLGAGLLTTAGIIGTAGAFASQRSLASLFAGLNIAFTQPIRIGDNVVVENESGQVEEITLSYVVIKLWDLRRLILPTDYFTNKGVLNLTRNSTELVGTILFYVDYSIPIDVLRNKFTEMLQESDIWDKKSSAFQVSELKEQSIQVRALVSARNSTDLWNLRCEIREKLLKFIVEHFPHALPKIRQIQISENN